MLSLKRLLLISRPVSYLPTAAIFAAGILKSHSGWSWGAALVTLYFTVPFGLVAYGINDIADREADAKNKRKGGIDGAALHAREVLPLSRIVAAIALVCPLLLWAGGHPVSAVFMAGLSLLSWAYSTRPVRLKSLPGIDSISNGVGILLIYLTGYLWQGAASGAVLPGLPLMCTILLFAAGVHAMGAVADITADRQAGDRTIGTVLGKTKTLLLCASAFAACYILIGRHHFVTGAYLLGCAALVLIASRVRRPRFVRNSGLLIIIAFPLAMLPAVFR